LRIAALWLTSQEFHLRPFPKVSCRPALASDAATETMERKAKRCTLIPTDPEPPDFQSSTLGPGRLRYCHKCICFHHTSSEGFRWAARCVCDQKEDSRQRCVCGPDDSDAWRSHFVYASIPSPRSWSDVFRTARKALSAQLMHPSGRAVEKSLQSDPRAAETM